MRVSYDGDDFELDPELSDEGGDSIESKLESDGDEYLVNTVDQLESSI